MMKDINYWHDIFKQKVYSLSYEDFLVQICSWIPFALHKNNGLISRFPESSRTSIVSRKDYQEHIDTLTSKGRNFDEKLTFFENFATFLPTISLPATFFYGTNENTEYCDSPVNAKDSYLCVLVLWSEQVYYSLFTRFNCTNVFNSFFVNTNSENIYFSRFIKESYQVFFSGYVTQGRDIWFSANLVWCSECIFCHDLENMQYCINNKQMEKEQYFQEKEKILKQKHMFLEWYKKSPFTWKNYNSTNVSGSSILECENIENGKYVTNTKNAKNVVMVGSPEGCENLYNAISAGSNGSCDLYSVASVGDNSHFVFCSHGIGSSFNIFYSVYLEGCSFCLGCIGLKNKSYCIFNKQYTKEDWEIQVEKIFSKMEQEGTLWDFFPWNINPFYFNDTLAGLTGKFGKKDIVEKWFLWREEGVNVDSSHQNDTIGISQLWKYQWYTSEGKWYISEEILQKTIQDDNGNVYRVLPQERLFLEKYSLPIPEIHWIERNKINLSF